MLRRLAMPMGRTLERYRDAMLPIVTTNSPASLALVAALVRESWIEDKYDLLHVHRELAVAAFDKLFQCPLVDDVAEILLSLVLNRLLLGWQDYFAPETDPRVPPMREEAWIALRRSELPSPCRFMRVQ